MPDTHINRLKCGITSVAGSGTGTITLASAESGFRTFASGDDGKTFSCLFLEGTDWEVATGCLYTHSGTTLTRGTLEASSSGSAITLTSAGKVSVIAPASLGNKVESLNPGGSSGQLQYNDSGSFGGASGLTTSGTELTIASGTKTSSTPPLTISQTWNSVGTTFDGLDLSFTTTASQGGSRVFRIRTGSSGTTTVFFIRRSGDTFATSFSDDAQWALAPASGIGSANVRTGLNFGSDASISWAVGGNIYAAKNLILLPDATNVLAQRNGANAQGFRLYNTFTDASNHERARLQWSSNVFLLGTEKAGTGTARAMELQTDGTTALTLTTAQKAEFAQTIKTAAPAGGTAAEWKLGTVATVSPTSPNRTIEIEIGGTTYYVSAKTTND